ncbi:MAG: histidine kinase [Actinomycetota bacterium]|nr:histidine kinase [Actinomycetota bacterium]
MTPLARSVWDEPRAPDPPPIQWWDRALVAVLAVVGLLEGILRPDLPLRPLSTVVGVGATSLLLVRRSRPLLAILVGFGCVLVLDMTRLVTGSDTPGLNAMAFLLLLVYAVCRWGSGREAVIGMVVVYAMATLGIFTEETSIGDAIGGYTIVSLAGALGIAFRYRGRARVRELEQVKLLERERLARDLHDTVAHHVSAMAIRAQAGLATVSTNPEAAADALRLIEAEAARTLAEMRTMVRALRRDEDAELAPNPTVADVRALAERNDSGPRVVVEIDGDADGLQPAIGAAVFRVAQEAVTNARRHARDATRVAVHVAVDERVVRVRVSDDGDTAGMRTVPAPGYGLLGMMERTDLLGGTCTAGPDDVRGWTVTAELPREATPS